MLESPRNDRARDLAQTFCMAEMTSKVTSEICFTRGSIVSRFIQGCPGSTCCRRYGHRHRSTAHKLSSIDPPKFVRQPAGNDSVVDKAAIESTSHV